MLMVTDGCANGVSHRHPFSSRFSSRRSTNTTPLTASFAKPTPPTVHSPSDPHTFHGLITRLRTVHHPSFPSFPNTKNRSSHLFFPPFFSHFVHLLSMDLQEERSWFTIELHNVNVNECIETQISSINRAGE